jgi:hypothetical protein
MKNTIVFEAFYVPLLCLHYLVLKPVTVTWIYIVHVLCLSSVSLLREVPKNSR